MIIWAPNPEQAVWEAASMARDLHATSWTVRPVKVPWWRRWGTRPWEMRITSTAPDSAPDLFYIHDGMVYCAECNLRLTARHARGCSLDPVKS